MRQMLRLTLKRALAGGGLAMLYFGLLLGMALFDGGAPDGPPVAQFGAAAGFWALCLFGGLAAAFSQFTGWYSTITANRRSAWGAAAAAMPNQMPLFLLHRPVARRRMVLLMMAVGLALLWLGGSTLILVVGYLSSTPGIVAAPFDWRMMEPWCRALVVLPVAYTGTWAGLLWPGRKGLCEASLGGLLFAFLLALLPYWWITAPVVSLLLSALFVQAALQAVELRDHV